MSNFNSTQKRLYIQQLDPGATVVEVDGGYCLESSIVILKKKGNYKLRRQGDSPEDAINQLWDRAVELRGDDEILQCGSRIGVFEYADMSWRLIEGANWEDWILDGYSQSTDAELDRLVRRQYRDPKWLKANEAHESEMRRLQHRREVAEEALRLLDEKEALSKRNTFASGFAVGGIGAMAYEVWKVFDRRRRGRGK